MEYGLMIGLAVVSAITVFVYINHKQNYPDTTTATEQRLSFNVSLAMDKRLDELVKRTGRSKSYCLEEAVARYLDEQEKSVLVQQERQANSFV